MFLSLLVTAMVVALDQFSKHFVVANLAYGDFVAIIPGVLQLTHVRNFGAAFGLFAGQRLLFFGAVLVIVLAFFFLRSEIVKAGRLAVVASGLVLGGALGNFIDRVRYGYVVDFIDFGFWPVFNVADSAIVMGTTLLAFVILRVEMR